MLTWVHFQVTYLQGSVDPYLRKDLAPRIVQLAERFAPDNVWFVETMLALFESAGDVIPPESLNNVLALVRNNFVWLVFLNPGGSQSSYLQIVRSLSEVLTATSVLRSI